MKPPHGFLKRALWSVQMFVLPCLGIFFLCPCGTIYNPKAPHGLRELSAVAEGVADVAAVPVVLVAMPVIGTFEGLTDNSSAQPLRGAKQAKPGEPKVIYENKNAPKPAW